MTGGADTEEVRGILMDVKRYAVHDGPGIRTTLFLKGCPLRCIWCHNPEGTTSAPQLAYYAHKCVQCGECARICPTGAHTMLSGVHAFERDKCRGCGLCADHCLGMALKVYGRIVTVAEALSIAIEDFPFFVNSGGGVTVSGGEPLVQADFCQALFLELKKRNVHIAVDTCGCVEWSAFEKVLSLTDLYLYDVKHIDEQKHKELTGRGNVLILDNLIRLSEARARIEVRIPLIPGCNDDRGTIQDIGRFLSKLRIEHVRVLPYHAMARGKYDALDKSYKMPDIPPPSDEVLNQAVDLLKGYGLNALPAVNRKSSIIKKQ